jgi:hypothetical protein
MPRLTGSQSLPERLPSSLRLKQRLMWHLERNGLIWTLPADSVFEAAAGSLLRCPGRGGCCCSGSQPRHELFSLTIVCGQLCRLTSLCASLPCLLTRAGIRQSSSGWNRNSDLAGSASSSAGFIRRAFLVCIGPGLADVFHARTERCQQRLQARAEAIGGGGRWRQQTSTGLSVQPCSARRSLNAVRARRRAPARFDLDCRSNGHAIG